MIYRASVKNSQTGPFFLVRLFTHTNIKLTTQSNTENGHVDLTDLTCEKPDFTKYNYLNSVTTLTILTTNRFQ